MARGAWPGTEAGAPTVAGTWRAPGVGGHQALPSRPSQLYPLTTLGPRMGPWAPSAWQGRALSLGGGDSEVNPAALGRQGPSPRPRPSHWPRRDWDVRCFSVSLPATGGPEAGRVACHRGAGHRPRSCALDARRSRRAPRKRSRQAGAPLSGKPVLKSPPAGRWPPRAPGPTRRDGLFSPRSRCPALAPAGPRPREDVSAVPPGWGPGGGPRTGRA